MKFMGDQYIRERLDPQIKYHDNKSQQSKKLYYRLSIFNIILLGAIPVVSLTADGFPSVKYIVAVASAVASIQTAILTFMKLKENWLSSRATCEDLISEREQYRCLAGPYKGLTHKEAAPILTERCEAIMSKERSSWSARMKDNNTQK